MIQGEQPFSIPELKTGIHLLLFFACCGAVLTDFDPQAGALYAGALWEETFNALPPEIRRTVCRWARQFRSEAGKVGLERLSGETSPIAKMAEAILNN